MPKLSELLASENLCLRVCGIIPLLRADQYHSGSLEIKEWRLRLFIPGSFAKVRKIV